MPFPGATGGRQTPIHDSERFERVFRWIEDHGGEYQRTAPLFAEDVGLGTNSLKNVLKRMERCGCLTVIRSGHPTLGLGRFPNLYRLRMTWAEWLVAKPAIVAKDRERQRAAMAAAGKKSLGRMGAKGRKTAARNRELKRRANMTVGPKWEPFSRLPDKWDEPPVVQGSTPPPARAYPPPNSPLVQGPAVERHREDDDLDLDAWGDTTDF